MSGAASIAAAKNRRTKPDPNQKPIISCSSKTGACPLPPGSKTLPSQPGNKSQNKLAQSTVFDEESLQITGPMPLMHVLKVHEQRLNKLDDKLSTMQTQTSIEPQQTFLAPQQAFLAPQACVEQACDTECYDRISVLEEKVLMLEEVIMNLQLTLTNVQSFAMETSLAMMKLQNKSRPTTPPPMPSLIPLVSEPTPVPATPVPATPVHVVLSVSELPTLVEAPSADAS